MLLTKQKNRKQIDSLKMDLEIINPIECKKVLGGDWYNELNNVDVWNNYHDYGGWWDDALGGNYNDPGSWGGGDYTGGGGDLSNALLENPSAAELWWLANKVTFSELSRMIDNKNFAFEKSAPLPGLTNGLGDAFRHALWSAADAADIGLARTIEFHTLHETSNPDDMGGLTNAMDLFNNNWGYNWFSQHGDPVSNMNQFITDFNTAVANGQIQTQP